MSHLRHDPILNKSIVADEGVLRDWNIHFKVEVRYPVQNGEDLQQKMQLAVNTRLDRLLSRQKYPLDLSCLTDRICPVLPCTDNVTASNMIADSIAAAFDGCPRLERPVPPPKLDSEEVPSSWDALKAVVAGPPAPNLETFSRRGPVPPKGPDPIDSINPLVYWEVPEQTDPNGLHDKAVAQFLDEGEAERWAARHGFYNRYEEYKPKKKHSSPWPLSRCSCCREREYKPSKTYFAWLYGPTDFTYQEKLAMRERAWQKYNEPDTMPLAVIRTGAVPGCLLQTDAKGLNDVGIILNLERKYYDRWARENCFANRYELFDANKNKLGFTAQELARQEALAAQEKEWQDKIEEWRDPEWLIKRLVNLQWEKISLSTAYVLGDVTDEDLDNYLYRQYELEKEFLGYGEEKAKAIREEVQAIYDHKLFVHTELIWWIAGHGIAFLVVSLFCPPAGVGAAIESGSIRAITSAVGTSIKQSVVYKTPIAGVSRTLMHQIDSYPLEHHLYALDLALAWRSKGKSLDVNIADTAASYYAAISFIVELVDMGFWTVISSSKVPEKAVKSLTSIIPKSLKGVVSTTSKKFKTQLKKTFLKALTDPEMIEALRVLSTAEGTNFVHAFANDQLKGSLVQLFQYVEKDMRGLFKEHYRDKEFWDALCRVRTR